MTYLTYLEPDLSLDGGLRILDSCYESYIGLIKHLSSTRKINIYAGHCVEMNNADVGVEDSDGGVEKVDFEVNDSGFNVEDVGVDFDYGPIVTHGTTGVAGVDPTGVGRLETDNVETDPSGDVEPSVVVDPRVPAEETGGVGLFGVVGSTGVETDNVEAGEEDINEGGANDEDEEEGTDDDNDSSYSYDTEVESEDLRGEV
ncbi:hypothetical protein V6N11_025580 [Hibiscus sabdariffa]|uniref:Uncharacterized protein n=1 Tax=Hibiscus sabdariffa TaxID=183260 RepID=A0ABR1ZRR1_9ROSI